MDFFLCILHRNAAYPTNYDQFSWFFFQDCCSITRTAIFLAPLMQLDGPNMNRYDTVAAFSDALNLILSHCVLQIRKMKESAYSKENKRRNTHQENDETGAKRDRK